MSFGQLVIGPPGAGKTTYVATMHHYLTQQKRPVACINLDPANSSVPYPVAIDLAELISMDDVMETFALGPNGGLIYCMEYLEKNIKWLREKIKAEQKKNPNVYFLFDLPGQVELYTHHASLKHIVEKMTNSWNLRLTCVHLIDSHHCSDAGKFISVLLLSLSSMTQLELPHVNVLSKMDLIESYGSLEFGLDFYTDVLDLSYLLPRIKEASAQHPLAKKFAKLHEALAGMIESYNLVSFLPLNISDPALVAQVAKTVDKANGCMYVQRENAETGGGAKDSTTQQQQYAQPQQKQINLLNAVDTSALHDVHLPDIQERYLPQTTQEAPRPRAAAAGSGKPAAAAAAPPIAAVVERAPAT